MSKFIRLAGCLALIAGLAACGVDGAPIPPSDEPETPEPGVTLSGSVSMGVSGGSGRSSISSTN